MPWLINLLPMHKVVGHCACVSGFLFSVIRNQHIRMMMLKDIT